MRDAGGEAEMERGEGPPCEAIAAVQQSQQQQALARTAAGCYCFVVSATALLLPASRVQSEM